MNRIDLDASLTALETMPLDELRVAWSRQVRTAPPKVSASLLRLAFAHHLQSKVMGGVPRTLERKLQEITEGQRASAVPAGTRLVREWRGKVHMVTVPDAGAYRWLDRDWNSLSEIAREITGTRWSGPAFFGTKARKKAA